MHYNCNQRVFNNLDYPADELSENIEEISSYM